VFIRGQAELMEKRIVDFERTKVEFKRLVF
jgi:hypothetical protein